MNIQDYSGVYTFIQQVDGVASGVSYELLGKATELAAKLNCKVTAILLGHKVAHLADSLAKAGADRVLLVDNEALKVYTTEPYTYAIENIIKKYKPSIILYGATAIGRDLAPRVAARMRTGLTADCTKLEIDEETKGLRMTRPAFGGNLMATIISPDHRPQMATVRPGVMKRCTKRENAKAEIEEFKLEFKKNDKYVEVTEIAKKIADKVDIMDAKILVSGGRGVGSKANFAILEDLSLIHI